MNGLIILLIAISLAACQPMCRPSTPLPPEDRLVLERHSTLPKISKAECERIIRENSHLPVWYLSNEYSSLCPEQVFRFSVEGPMAVVTTAPAVVQQLSLPFTSSVPPAISEERPSVVIRHEEEQSVQPRRTSSSQSSQSHADKVWVRPYVRKDGTKVRGHWRKKP